MLNKIAKVRQYKSFDDFTWDEFCKNKDGKIACFKKFNIIFGENGAGKSSICDILKSLSQSQAFQKSPNLAEVVFDDQTYKYENDVWIPPALPKNTFLFFDVDFINANVHTHGDRFNQKDQHSQNAGKIVIDLDLTANNLKELVDLKRNELEGFQKMHSDVLQQTFSDKDIELFRAYENMDIKDKEDKVSRLREEINDLETKNDSLQMLNKKHLEITNINPISKVAFTNSLSSKEGYIELFRRQIKEKAQDDADIQIKATSKAIKDSLKVL